MERFNRLINLIGMEKYQILCQKKVIVFGLGGVGSFAAEVLVRNGIGEVHVVDFDLVDITNINRQLLALENTIGQYKTDVFVERALAINPKLKLVVHQTKVDATNVNLILGEKFDYVADCIDDLKAKVAIAKYCLDNSISFISSMGFANKMKPEMIKVAKLNQTSVCPIAKIMRRDLKIAGYSLNFPVVFSEEKPNDV
ncbi:MAG: tRNA threonylcarbamoyladenosine dehydratase, partial [Candidatus Izemoplasmatales bacterium]|nr:tRNA threonylcarbamoyladenosine dehydratase [Candidatus Izemoplasmatales bacterium]